MVRAPAFLLVEKEEMLRAKAIMPLMANMAMQQYLEWVIGRGVW